MQFVGYVRVSDKERQELSFEGQEAALRKWCEANDHTLLEVVKEKISSGVPLEKRHGLLKAFHRAKGCDGLLVIRRDRLARCTYEALRIEQNVKVFALDGFNGTEPGDVLMRTILYAFAEHERATIRGRIKAALDHKRSRGEAVSGKAPYGYHIEAGKLVEEPDEQVVLKHIQNLQRQFHKSQTQIVHWLNSKGYRTRSNKPWGQSQISRILKRMREREDAD